MKSILFLAFAPALLLASGASAELPCSKLHGTVTFEDGWAEAFPSHIDRLLPPVLTLDIGCRVRKAGTFTGCVFTPQEAVTDKQRELLGKIVPRLMRSVRTNAEPQTCVLTTLTLRNDGQPSISSPNEAAGERVVPDRSDQDSG